MVLGKSKVDGDGLAVPQLASVSTRISQPRESPEAEYVEVAIRFGREPRDDVF
jgi:hypothetical protein